MTREICLQNANGIGSTPRQSDPQGVPSADNAVNVLLADRFVAQKTCLCTGCCNQQRALPQNTGEKDFVALNEPITIAIDNNSFLFEARGSLTAEQKVEVDRSLKNFRHRLGLLSTGKSHRNWALQKVYDEKPIRFCFMTTEQFAPELKQLGFSEAWVDAAKNKVSGLYIESTGEIIVLVDSWANPGTSVSVESTLNHEVMHALDDLLYTDPEDEPNNGFLTDALRENIDAHWEGGFRRAGLTENPFNEIQKYISARDYVAAHSPDAKAAQPVFGDYTIRKNDTLSSIAQKHRTPLATLLEDNANNILNPDKIHPGQRLKVRTGSVNPDRQTWNSQFEIMSHFEQNILQSFPRVYGATGYQEFGVNRESPRHEFFAVAGETFLDPTEKEYFKRQNPHFFEGLCALLSDQPVDESIAVFRREITQPWPALPAKLETKFASLEELLGKPLERKSHTVKAGETLSEICQKYGYKIIDVTRHNGIKNPHFLKIGSVIEFPEKN